MSFIKHKMDMSTKCSHFSLQSHLSFTPFRSSEGSSRGQFTLPASSLTSSAGSIRRMDGGYSSNRSSREDSSPRDVRNLTKESKQIKCSFRTLFRKKPRIATTKMKKSHPESKMTIWRLDHQLRPLKRVPSPQPLIGN